MDISAPLSDPERDFVLAAAQNGQVDVVRARLEEKPSLIWARKPVSGETLLHLALANNNTELAVLLLQKGANPEVADSEGWKPLALAARNGLPLLPFAELLLQYGANPDSINLRVKQSALHLCAAEGFPQLARILLDRGAQVDLGDVYGETPLFKAVAGQSTDMVKLLLRYGANRNVRSAQGVTVESLAHGNADILRLLRSAQVLSGPRVARREQRRAGTETQTLVALNPAPLDDQAKLVACHAFQATIVDFHVGESEERIERTLSVYEILYGQGAEAIMKRARSGEIEGNPSFRWYHLPANNMEWVETLVRRHFAERNPRKGQYTEPLAADLGMRRTYNDHHLVFTSKGSFIRPFCRKVKSSSSESDTGVGRYVGAFIPYLHFEIQEDFEAMSKAITKAIDSWTIPLPTHDHIPAGEGEERQPGSDNSRLGSRDSNSRQSQLHDRHSELSTDQATISGRLHDILFQGYMKPGLGGEVPPLQIRRTLDHYFYSHLASTSARDRDQVIQRYTYEFDNVNTKMFMVDQLWLWVLDDDTVISCCPLRWDSWATGQPDPMLGQQPNPDGPRTWNDFVIKQNDPLNIHQTVIQHLKNVRRESITSVEDLSRTITSACLNAFDHYEIPDEYHFFDFVEYSIGQVMDKTTQSFDNFQKFLGTPAAGHELLSAMNVNNIEVETKLLGEIEDIRDELSILRLVLEDQKRVAEELDTLLGHQGPSNDAEDALAGEKSYYTLKKNRVLENHLARIDRMEALTKRSIQSIRSLLKLKQQQATLSEAKSAREQAEYTSRQTKLATQYNLKIAQQLTLAQQQAEETAKQGNVILLFTVVTVVFLPLSFMTSFFTIEIDVFPFDDQGRMPIGYILGIILSVSAGVSIPFILLAFNFDKVFNWCKSIIMWAKTARLVLGLMASIILILIIALAVTLSQPIDAGIKAGVGIGLGLLVVIALIFLFILKGWHPGRHRKE
ncbi:hypothetical protein F4806DRAFT_80154 [Annulohypoxylon nitens]|nr:hypothetical protein F4806DRAFT_80154 [Annulohypoxylon nitens]